ncbi:MAG: DUF4982 domain-containing protein [Prevotella sp.]|nr:DUF4982 domain-containing protein [Prevotella sp.]
MECRQRARLLRAVLFVALLNGVLAAWADGHVERVRQLFNEGWLLQVGDIADASRNDCDDLHWKPVTLPLAFNGKEAFARDIVDLTDTISWYRKHFRIDQLDGRKFFIEFEGARQGADVYLNGHHLGFSENGVMAFGFDLTPYLQPGENVLAVRCDNSWAYRSRRYDSRYQWNDRNFNANYGGIPKNVYLHITGRLYQTLPLVSSLGTTGTYIYATDYDIAGRTATIHAESQVRNDDDSAHTVALTVAVKDADGKTVALFSGEEKTVPSGETLTLEAAQRVGGLHFWSWGYGYLYTVETSLATDRQAASLPEDVVVTRTGFRKTEFKDGKIWLNDRCLMVHGYAQRTSNEWPGVGLSVPTWLSDYSNGLMVESGGNLVRWMHVTPWKQDVESCDRVGLIQAMPAGDAEKDVDGPRWEQRVELMRDAIVYNRNNPSILFYECGNFRISAEHMMQMKQLRDEFDPRGGRAIGSREMLDRPEAEYGGEMLYINKSGGKPMWAMEYCRDEGLRKYWDAWSYPFHPEGEGPLYRGKPAREYNHNQDEMAVEMVRRWHEYWQERPGTGRRVSSGGVKIVFSDTNTHHRGESNYRTSGVVDAMRLPKDAFYAHQVMWDGWVEPEQQHTHIVGHWNYPEGTVKPVYVVSNADSVQLFVNGRSVGWGQRSYQYLFTFPGVAFELGQVEAVGVKDGVAVSRDRKETAGEPWQLRLTTIENPEGMKADGADMALVEVEVLDREGRRCPLDDRLVHFEIRGEGQWIGGIGVRSNATQEETVAQHDPELLDAAATRNLSDNYVGSYMLPVECGVNRVLVRSTVTAGTMTVAAYADGVRPASVTLNTTRPVDGTLPSLTLPSRLTRGETFSSPSYNDFFSSVEIAGATAGSNGTAVQQSYDDNELTEWRSDGQRDHAWISYRLAQPSRVDELVMKLAGWRTKHYPLAVYAKVSGKNRGKTAGKRANGGREVLLWQGVTEPTLGYVHLPLDAGGAVEASEIIIRMLGPATDKVEQGDTKELAGGKAAELDRISSAKGAVDLRIVEVDILKRNN